MAQPIVLYDLASQSGMTISSNIWKVRLSLDYKKIPYTIIKLEIPAIEPTCKEIGAPPTTVNDDGTPRYTVPTILDPNSGAAISDSAKIVRYLDEHYPATPRVIPVGTSALHAAFDTAFSALVLPGLTPLLAPTTASLLNPPTRAVMLKRFAAAGFKPVEYYELPDAREECWKLLEDGFGKIGAWLSLDGTAPPYFTGEQISYADFTVTAFLISARMMFGEDSADWARIEGFVGEKWVELTEGR